MSKKHLEIFESILDNAAFEYRHEILKSYSDVQTYAVVMFNLIISTRTAKRIRGASLVLIKELQQECDWENAWNRARTKIINI